MHARTGEYLMMLPQTLEGLLGAPDQAGQPPVDAEWLDRVRPPALACDSTFLACSPLKRVSTHRVT